MQKRMRLIVTLFLFARVNHTLQLLSKERACKILSDKLFQRTQR